MLPAPQLFKWVRVIKVRLWLKGKLCFNIKNKDIVQFEEQIKVEKEKLNVISNTSEYII